MGRGKSSNPRGGQFKKGGGREEAGSRQETPTRSRKSKSDFGEYDLGAIDSTKLNDGEYRAKRAKQFRDLAAKLAEKAKHEKDPEKRKRLEDIRKKAETAANTHEKAAAKLGVSKSDGKSNGKTSWPLMSRKSYEDKSKADAKAIYAAREAEGMEDALTRYTYTQYEEINSFARGHLDDDPDYAEGDYRDEMNEIVSNIDKAILASTPLSEDIVVHRGISGDFAKKIAGLKPGDSFSDKGFVSTSIEEKIVSTYSEDGVVVKMNLPKGSRALGMSAFASPEHPDGDQGELLLPRGTKMKVVQVETIDGATFVHVDVDTGSR